VPAAERQAQKTIVWGAVEATGKQAREQDPTEPVQKPAVAVR
jgi:hypothetical protein